LPANRERNTKRKLAQPNKIRIAIHTNPAEREKEKENTASKWKPFGNTSILPKK
jgi:hypothetical protein